MENTIDSLQVKINESRAQLSEDSRRAIDAISWKLTILEMGEKYNPEQLEDLTTETELLLCGLVSTEDYPKELETRMKISKEEIVILLNEMDRLIFKKIQAELEKRINLEEKIEEKKKPSVLDRQFEKMPEVVRDAITKFDWKNKLYEIATKYKLNIEQMGYLEDITKKTITNEIHPDKYESELTSKITIQKEDMTNLINDVNENIFKKIREEEKTTITNENTEEIPLPPYKISSRQNVESSKEEEIQKQNTNDTTKEVEPMKTIDLKPKSFDIPKSPVENKLTGPTVSENTVSDYSDPLTNKHFSDLNSPKSSDPYREAI